MRKFLRSFVFVSAALLFAASALADNHAVKIAQKHEPGTFLTDAKGMTLYWFKNDSVGKSACMGGCLEKWPIYFRDKVAAPDGVKAEDFGTIKRDDGKSQTTFRGYPLYYFAGDKAAGDTTGQGARDVWFVVDPGSFMLKK